jgi:hypothetical protein
MTWLSERVAWVTRWVTADDRASNRLLKDDGGW